MTDPHQARHHQGCGHGWGEGLNCPCAFCVKKRQARNALLDQARWLTDYLGPETAYTAELLREAAALLSPQQPGTIWPVAVGSGGIDSCGCSNINGTKLPCAKHQADPARVQSEDGSQATGSATLSFSPSTVSEGEPPALDASPLESIVLQWQAVQHELGYMDAMKAGPAFDRKMAESANLLNKIREWRREASPLDQRIQEVVAEMRRAVRASGESAMSPYRTTNEAALINGALAAVDRYANMLDAALTREGSVPRAPSLKGTE